MNRSDIGRVQQQATRTVMPGMTRQSTTTSALGSRGAQYRAAEMRRGAPSQRGAATTDDDKDKDEDEDEKPISGRDDKDDDGADGNTDDPDDDKDDDDKDVKGKKSKTAA